jgi:hypothetical protein
MGTYSLTFFFMWLFDDLLKKPSNETSTSDMGIGGQTSQSSGSAGKPPVQDPLVQAEIKIEKTEGTILQTTPVFEINTDTHTPVDTIIHPLAEVWKETETLSNDTSNEEEDDFSAILINAPTGATDIPIASIDIENQEEKNIQNNNPSLIGSPILEIPEALQSESLNIPWVENAVWTNPYSMASGGILWFSNEDKMVNDGNNFMEGSKINEQKEINSSAINGTENIAPTENFTDTISFIQDSLNKIELMLEAIHKRHASKIDEALGYKSEKERFADLEKQAYKDADSMNSEIDHTERMKSYFTKELKHATEKDNQTIQIESVETTLTTLAVKNTVEWVTEKKDVQKRAKAKMDV